MKALWPVIYREYRFRKTNWAYIFWDIFVPVAYLLIFAFGLTESFDLSFGAGQVDYASFFLAGVLSMTSFGIAMNTSWRFFMERDSGIFYELLTYPISRREFVFGKILFSIFLSYIGSIAAVILGRIFLDLQLNIRLLGFSAGIIIGTAGWFFLFSVIALRVRRIDAFNTITSVLYIVLMFASSLFYPIDDLPLWFRIAAYLNPFTWQTDVLRYYTVGIGDPSTLILESAAFFLFTVGSFFWAVWALNRAGE